jgi:hypothetical protein
MDLKLPPGQGRAPCLYDEQLQRQQQEKALIEGAAVSGFGRPMLFGGDAADTKTGAP